MAFLSGVALAKQETHATLMFKQNDRWVNSPPHKNRLQPVINQPMDQHQTPPCDDYRNEDIDAESAGRTDNSACQSCPNSHACRTVWETPNRGPLSSAGLTIGSAIAFVLPLLTAAAGGAVFRHFFGEQKPIPWPEIGGAAVGLAIGAALGWVLLPWIGKRLPAKDKSTSP